MIYKKLPQDELFLFSQEENKNNKCYNKNFYWPHLRSAFNLNHCFRLLIIFSILTIYFIIWNIYYELKIKSNRLSDLAKVSSYKDIQNIQNGSLKNHLKFVKPPIMQHLQCDKILENNRNYIENFAIPNRIAYSSDLVNLPMDCDSIRQRHYFPKKSASIIEKLFPIAFSKTVYKDYLFLEMEFAITYAPQNFYCFAIDKKSNARFRERIYALASCFPSNVFIPSVEYEMDSSGHNMTSSHFECMKILAKPKFQWNYFIILQNHDITLKTNEELVQILKWFHGANDIEVIKIVEERIDWTLDWSFQHLKLFKNATRNRIIYKNFEPKLNLAKGLVESSVTRAMIDFIVNELDITILLKQLEVKEYGVDEIFLSTLQATEALDAPGTFTYACLDKQIDVSYLTRFTLWGENNPDCKSKQNRHWLCIFGIEDLAPNLRNSPYLFANKMVPDFDFGAIVCWHETIFNRTYINRGLHRIKANNYESLPHVRYNRKKNVYRNYFDMNSFNCTYKAN